MNPLWLFSDFRFWCIATERHETHAAGGECQPKYAYWLWERSGTWDQWEASQSCRWRNQATINKGYSQNHSSKEENDSQFKVSNRIDLIKAALVLELELELGFNLVNHIKPRVNPNTNTNMNWIHIGTGIGIPPRFLWGCSFGYWIPFLSHLRSYTQKLGLIQRPETHQDVIEDSRFGCGETQNWLIMKMKAETSAYTSLVDSSPVL